MLMFSHDFRELDELMDVAHKPLYAYIYIYRIESYEESFSATTKLFCIFGCCEMLLHWKNISVVMIPHVFLSYKFKTLIQE